MTQDKIEPLLASDTERKLYEEQFSKHYNAKVFMFMTNREIALQFYIFGFKDADLGRE